MIACSNKKCINEWFHVECVNVDLGNGGQWTCEECLITPPHINDNERDSVGK